MSMLPSVLAAVFLDVPQKTFIGINLSSFSTSPDFVGIKNIPPGLHFLYSGTDASLSIRNGYWIQVSSTQDREPRAIILGWNKSVESLELLDDQLEAPRKVRHDLPEYLKRELVDYRTLAHATATLKASQESIYISHTVDTKAEIDPWPRLKSHISPRLLNRVLLNRATHIDVIEADRPAWNLTSVSSAPEDTEHIPGLSESESGSVLASLATIHLLPIDLKHTWPEAAIGRERTEKARDRSWYLSHLIENICSGSDGSGKLDKQAGARELLGEFQFCFVMVLTLANYSCLEQWKRILAVFFTCENALKEVEAYFIEVIKVLREQLRRVDDVEGGLFELRDEQASAWLRRLLRNFRRNVDEAFEGNQVQLKKELKVLEDWLRDTYSWEDQDQILRKGMIQLEDGEMVEMQMSGFDEEEETGEYAPTIVEA